MSKEGNSRMPADRVLGSLLNPNVQKLLNSNNPEVVPSIHQLCQGFSPEVRRYLILKTARVLEGMSKDPSKEALFGSPSGLFNFLRAIPTEGITLGPEDIVFLRNTLESFPPETVRELGLIPEGTRIRRPGVSFKNALISSKNLQPDSETISSPLGVAEFWGVLSDLFSEGKRLSKVQLAKKTGIHPTMLTNGPKRGNLPSRERLVEILAVLPEDKKVTLQAAFDHAQITRKTSRQKKPQKW